MVLIPPSSASSHAITDRPTDFNDGEKAKLKEQKNAN